MENDIEKIKSNQKTLRKVLINRLQKEIANPSSKVSINKQFSLYNKLKQLIEEEELEGININSIPTSWNMLNFSEKPKD